MASKANCFKTNYEIAISEYDLDNVPVLRDEPYVNDKDNYRSSAKYELSYTKFPNSTLEHYSTTWDDVVKTIYKNENFGNELNKSSYFKRDVDALMANVSDTNGESCAHFQSCETSVKWNSYYGKYTDVGVKKAYKDHVGNVTEINLMLTAMLRYAGLNANPVLVSSRNNGAFVSNQRWV